MKRDSWWMVGLSVVMIFSGCSKKSTSDDMPHEAANSPKVKPPSVTPIDPSSPVVDDSVSSAANLDAVDEQGVAFDDMINSLRTYAGVETPMNTNQVDLASFVQGKSEQVLLEFAEQSSRTSPFAALQVFGYLAEHAKDPLVLVTAAGWYAELIQTYGYAEDREKAHDHFEQLLALYAAPESMQVMTPEDRERMIATIQKHTLVLAMESDVWKKVTPVIRQHAVSDVERTYADYYDAMAILWSGEADKYGEARNHLQAIKDRNVYGSYFAGQEEVTFWLDLEDGALAEEVAAGQQMRAAVYQSMKNKWSVMDSKTPAERIGM